MTNAPTNSAIPPKTSSAVRKKPNSSSRSAACCVGVLAAGAHGHRLALRARSARGRAAASARRRRSAATEIPSSLPCRPVSACAVGSVAIATGSAGRARRRRRTSRRPTSVKLRAPSLADDLHAVAELEALRPSKVLWSRPISVARAARGRATKRNCSNGAGCSEDDEARVGDRVAVALADRDLAEDRARRPTVTPSTARTRARGRRRAAAGRRRSRRRPSSARPRRPCRVFACAKTSVNERLIVSVKM